MKKIISKIGVFALSISFVFANTGVMSFAETVSENTVETESECVEDTLGETLEEEASIIVSGTSENVSWTLDSTGFLLVTINGEYGNEKQLIKETNLYEHRKEVKSIKVKGNASGNCGFLLANFDTVTQIDLSELDTTNVTDMHYMFSYCESLEKINLENINTKNVTNMSSMFGGCYKLKQIDLSGFNTAKVKNMNGMFWGCLALEELDLSSFNTSKVNKYEHMFTNCRNMKKVNLSSFDTSIAYSMQYMFQNCSSLVELDLSNFNTKNVEVMAEMFSGCTSLEKLNISSFRTPNLYWINDMFNNCSALKSVDLSQFNLYNIESHSGKAEYEGMFENCNSIETIYLPAWIRADLYLPFSMYDEKNNICNAATKELSVPMQYSKNKFSSGTPTNPSQPNDPSNPSNPSNPNNPSQAEIENQIRAFVSRMYTVVLGREAEEEGLNYWSDQLIQHTYDGAGLARGFICSDEFTSKNLNNEAYVYVLYKTFFDREPDEGGMAYWMDALNDGTSRNTVLAGFVNSKEFAAICDRYGIARGTMEENGSSIYNAGVRDFVLRMYTKCLKRDGETLGVEYWSHCINTKEISPEDVAKNFFTSAEFVNKNLSNEEYVETLYETFMDRPSDVVGRQYWVERLDVGMSRTVVLEGFARSQEFAKIMEDFGL